MTDHTLSMLHHTAGLTDEEAEYTARMRKAERQQANTRVRLPYDVKLYTYTIMSSSQQSFWQHSCCNIGNA